MLPVPLHRSHLTGLSQSRHMRVLSPTPSHYSPWQRSNEISCNAISIDNLELREVIQDIFYQDFPDLVEDEMGISEDNRKAVEIVKNSIRFNKTLGKYQVALPWRHGRAEEKRVLGSVDCKSMALRRV